MLTTNDIVLILFGLLILFLISKQNENFNIPELISMLPKDVSRNSTFLKSCQKILLPSPKGTLMALCTDSYSKTIISSINYTTCMKHSDA